jgi:hypothetical protein
MTPRIIAALVVSLGCLSRMHVTVAMGSASVSMTGLAWFFTGVVVAVAVTLVLVIRRAAADGLRVAPRRRTA